MITNRLKMIFALPVVLLVAYGTLFASLLFFHIPMQEGMSCPFMPGGMSICPMTFPQHLGHWQTAFASVLLELLGLAALALVFSKRTHGLILREAYRAPPPRHRLLPSLPPFKNLFLALILSPRAP